MKFTCFIISFFFTFLTIDSIAQKRMYDIKLFGNVVGEISIEKKVVNDSEYTFHFNSDAEAVLFFIKTKTRAITNLSFKNNLLINGYVLRQKNDERQELSYQWDGTRYQITDNDTETTIDRKIYYCTAHFFIDEPVNIKEVFVERFNYFVPIEHLGDGKYLTKVDGGTNLYTYENGILKSLKSTKGVSLFMELRE